MSRWLEDFAYRVDINIITFALAGAAALTIAIATVSYQAIKTALINPVETIRYE
jgi:putative ABC transport system permease protein